MVTTRNWMLDDRKNPQKCAYFNINCDTKEEYKSVKRRYFIWVFVLRSDLSDFWHEPLKMSYIVTNSNHNKKTFQWISEISHAGSDATAREVILNTDDKYVVVQ